MLRQWIDEVQMAIPVEPEGRGYDKLYEEFDSPLWQQLRREAYGEDIGQHSWVTADELQEDISLLKLARASHFLDLGCGPGGPLTFVVGHVGCQGSGIDVSAKAIAAGRAQQRLLSHSHRCRYPDTRHDLQRRSAAHLGHNRDRGNGSRARA